MPIVILISPVSCGIADVVAMTSPKIVYHYQYHNRKYRRLFERPWWKLECWTKRRSSGWADGPRRNRCRRLHRRYCYFHSIPSRTARVVRLERRPTPSSGRKMKLTLHSTPGANWKVAAEILFSSRFLSTMSRSILTNKSRWLNSRNPSALELIKTYSKEQNLQLDGTWRKKKI